MAKKGKIPKPKAPSAAMENVEQPRVKWQTIGIIVAAFAVLWITAFMIQSSTDSPYGWIPVGIVAILTCAGIGFGIYIWRLTKKSRSIVDILSQATDEEGLLKALEQLEAGDDSDAMNALARAQLVAQREPLEAIKILEAIEIDKAPAMIQDDVRANLGMLYLVNGRAKDARTLADNLRLDRQPNPKAKAMYAAVCAEAFARTGKTDEAKRLLETYAADDPEYGDVSGMLYRAQVYAYYRGKQKGLAQKAMRNMAKIDPNLLAPFLGKRVRPELSKMATKALKDMGMAPKRKMQVQRRM